MDSEKNKVDKCPRDVKKQFKNQILIPTLLNFGQAIGMIFGCRVSKGGVQNLERFWLQINIPKGNYYILRTNVGASNQKVKKPVFQSQ